MTSAPTLFDRSALALRRARVTEDALFLHHAAVEEAQDRLSMVKRTFTDVAIVTPFPEIWRPAFPDARIVADEDTLDLTPDAQDLVIHAMAMHWANDAVGQLIQSRRALRPDGLFLGMMLGGTTLADLRAMGETNVLAQRLRRPSRRAIFAEAERLYPRTDANRLIAEFELICLTGWSPDESQPKPLRPGSARTRLADALGTSETPLAD